MNQIRSIKGTHDILPAQSKDWQDLEIKSIKLQTFMAIKKLELQ